MPRRKRSSTASPKFLALGAVGFACLLTVGLVLLMGAPEGGVSRKSGGAPAPAVLEVLVTAQDIEEGTELKPILFRRESRPAKDFAAGNAVGKVEQLRGVYAASFIPAGQVVLPEHVTTRAPVNSVVPRIRPGFRAISVELDKQTTNEGWARSGVRVDVLLATSQGNRAAAIVIAQNLRVLSSGTSVSSEFGGDSKLNQKGSSTVTLEVSAEDQKRLKLAAGRPYAPW
jgi:Flp pilus assembly protein CpaB